MTTADRLRALERRMRTHAARHEHLAAREVDRNHLEGWRERRRHHMAVAAASRGWANDVRQLIRQEES